MHRYLYTIEPSDIGHPYIKVKGCVYPIGYVTPDDVGKRVYINVKDWTIVVQDEV